MEDNVDAEEELPKLDEGERDPDPETRSLDLFSFKENVSSTVSH